MLGELSLTEFLALAFGLYMIAAGIGLLSEGDNYNQILSEFKDNAALGYIAGIMAFALGVVIVRLHNDWSSVVAGVVSLIGWAALVEGVLMLAFRRTFLGVFAGINFSSAVTRGFGIVCIALGAWLVFSGWA